MSREGSCRTPYCMTFYCLPRDRRCRSWYHAVCSHQVGVVEGSLATFLSVEDIVGAATGLMKE